MSIFDNLEDKAKDAMNDPDKRAQIEQLAKEKGISMEDAAKMHIQKEQNG